MFLQPILLLAVCYLNFINRDTDWDNFVLPEIWLNLAVLLVTALVCHGELARIAWDRLNFRRPLRFLEIFCWLWLGIALGQFFNQSIALVFTSMA